MMQVLVLGKKCVACTYALSLYESVEIASTPRTQSFFTNYSLMFVYIFMYICGQDAQILSITTTYLWRRAKALCRRAFFETRGWGVVSRLHCDVLLRRSVLLRLGATTTYLRYVDPKKKSNKVFAPYYRFVLAHKKKSTGFLWRIGCLFSHFSQ